ncbi:unnamed protein product [Paramecium sonneborni]|uniref:Uncharacterized protein n=1 Tax=Paramecium sonneborni TaxID=65129 RepID=A0A8S1LVN4_9CILI|nr:unnamed protein product [Paramecium sonneborni]
MSISYDYDQMPLKKILLELIIWQAGVQINQFSKWDDEMKRILQTKLKIIFTDDQKIKYVTEDGSILRIDEIKDLSQQPLIMKNLDQIKNLQFIGQYGNNLKKVGKWKTVWKGQTISDARAFYSEEGEKQGLWKGCIDNFWSLAQIFEIGKFEKNQRIGIFTYIYENEEIGGGNYNEKGLKEGQWIDLSPNFYNYSEVTYNGEYRNGKKIGKWDIKYRRIETDQFLKIGWGQYDDQGFKNGKWIELKENFSMYSQVKYIGEYQNGLKIGRWDSIFDKELIGGGFYDLQGQKQGKWIELSNNFYDLAQVIYIGEYCNNEKVGIWQANCRNDQNEPFEQIGGGQYEQNEQKNGHWIDLSDNYSSFAQVTFSGVYLNNQKIGRWDINFKQDVDKPIQLIGGGSYDEQGQKNDKWIELKDTFDQENYVIFSGQYQNGQKIGRWDINFKSNQNMPIQLIGGGLYDEQGLKNGQWIEIIEDFKKEKQITHVCQYKRGIKFGQENIVYFYNEIIGGGVYDEQFMKTGEWIELSDDFKDSKRITYIGLYQNGIKVGQWKTNFRGDCNKPSQQIGSGYYDMDGQKYGDWTEINKYFYKDAQIIRKGQYKNNQKIGIWSTHFRDLGKDSYQKIGGGLYDIQGFKTGIWFDQSYAFNFGSELSENGVYQNGQRHGRWKITYDKKMIGGGYYDNQGQKIRKWREIIDNFNQQAQVIFSGSYKNGIKVGLWEQYYKQDYRFDFIGCGLYDNQGLKIGIWIDLIQDFTFWNQVIYIGQYIQDTKVGTWIQKQKDPQKYEKEFVQIGEQNY